MYIYIYIYIYTQQPALEKLGSRQHNPSQQAALEKLGSFGEPAIS